VCLLGVAIWPGPVRVRTADTFADTVARLSEPGGYFDTDNLISNEASYLDVVPALVSGRVEGGAYIGVGPDQNFSYIARVRPSIAYIVDIRRDNLLLHLLFKTLFAEARTRAEYLAALTGRPPPPDGERWSKESLRNIIEYIDATPVSAEAVQRLRDRRGQMLARLGLPLSKDDLGAIDRFHGEFIKAALDLRFHTFGRPPQYYYPTLRELLAASDRAGQLWSYLASEADYQFLRQLQADDKVIPVVGDLGGTRAMKAVADDIAARRLRVSAFYISNVERYLDGDAYTRFIENMDRLPHDKGSVIIRSVFGGGASVSSVRRIDDVVTGALR
jgi:hypothetical protein